MTKVQNTCGDLVLGWFTPQLIMKQGEAQGAKLSMRVSSLINVGSYRAVSYTHLTLPTKRIV